MYAAGPSGTDAALVPDGALPSRDLYLVWGRPTQKRCGVAAAAGKRKRPVCRTKTTIGTIGPTTATATL